MDVLASGRGRRWQFLRQKFANKPDIAEANVTAFKAGWNYGETTEAFAVAYEVKPAPLPAGTYRNISGNVALAYGLITAAQRAELPLFLGAYPITPGVGHPARAVQAQALRRAHLPGRGRDRGHRRGDRSGVRRIARSHDVVRARASR